MKALQETAVGAIKCYCLLPLIGHFVINTSVTAVTLSPGALYSLNCFIFMGISSWSFSLSQSQK